MFPIYNVYKKLQRRAPTIGRVLTVQLFFFLKSRGRATCLERPLPKGFYIKKVETAEKKADSVHTPLALNTC